MKKIILVTFVVLSIFTLLYIFTSEETEVAVIQDENEEIFIPTIEYGIALDSFMVYKDVIAPNQYLANILLKYNIPYTDIDMLVKKSHDIFDVRKIASGKKYTILCSKDSIGKAQCFIYEPNETEYVIFDMRDSISIYKGQKEVVTKIKHIKGTINSSLYKTLSDKKASPVLAIEMANVYAWTIDFYSIQKGDWFDVVYEEKYVGDQFVGIGKILAANFNHYDKDYYAYRFEQDGITNFFDEKGKSLKRAFLKSPLEFGKLTSGFTMKRFHPVQKINKPHLGTDYAAPTGTPILATGDGVVIESAHKIYNGNYVKIKHNSTYTTQYLHMSKRLAKTGQHVKQGDVIGYVGSTGLATGPHVCYRFWKNGAQTNHLKEETPPADPVKKEHKERFILLKDSLNKKMNPPAEIVVL
ncbi:MAG: peptidase M23 [Flavobacteriales bacterium CG18_big_fil_WC_8_21_14_2_50_32_9]|nr:MAG: peptidase M23 [Flavobacteriales bacterium CG18_big_fil_WC_8_21_14_2_50_32_9]